MSSLEDYQNIRKLFSKHKGEDIAVAKEFLSTFKDSYLKTINRCLSVVDIEEEPTQDWMRELIKTDIDRINSVFSEILLLYHLREKFGHENVEMNAKINGSSNSVDFDLKMHLDSETWIEIVKRDHSSSFPDKGGYISNQGTGKSIDGKLKDKFIEAREHLSEEKNLILAVYLEEMIGQSLEIGKWLNEEYYDVSEICDGLILYTHLEETRFKFYPFTEKGREILEKIEDGLE